MGVCTRVYLRSGHPVWGEETQGGPSVACHCALLSCLACSFATMPLPFTAACQDALQGHRTPPKNKRGSLYSHSLRWNLSSSDTKHAHPTKLLRADLVGPPCVFLHDPPPLPGQLGDRRNSRPLAEDPDKTHSAKSSKRHDSRDSQCLGQLLLHQCCTVLSQENTSSRQTSHVPAASHSPRSQNAPPTGFFIVRPSLVSSCAKGRQRNLSERK